MIELMEINEVEYKNLTKGKGPIFCCQEFLKLNEYKVDKIHYLLGGDSKKRIAFAIGEKEGEWKAPFSAPFSTFIELKKNTDLEYYWEFIKELIQYVKNNFGKGINIYLPPDIYYNEQNSKIVNALLGNGFSVEYQEVNYSINIREITDEGYLSRMFYNGRKNLKISLKSNLDFIRCETQEEKMEAYRVIKINRESKGYYLAMSEKQVFDTIQIVPHDFFLVTHDGKSVASAIVFRVSEKIVQVVYWGDIPNVGELKSINYLAYMLVKFYSNQGVECIDIGPSSPEGIPNFGLCSFKESIGCDVSTKLRFDLRLC